MVQVPATTEPSEEPNDGAGDAPANQGPRVDVLDGLAGGELLSSLEEPAIEALQADLAPWVAENDHDISELELTYVGTSPDGDPQVTFVTSGSTVITGTETDGRWTFNSISVTPEAYEGGDREASVG